MKNARFFVIAAVGLIAAGIYFGASAGAGTADERVEAGDAFVKLSCVSGPDDEYARAGAGFVQSSLGSTSAEDAPNFLNVGPSTVQSLERVSDQTFVQRGVEGDVDAAYVVGEIEGRFYVVEVIYCLDRMTVVGQ